jgi:hypothetical protein
LEGISLLSILEGISLLSILGAFFIVHFWREFHYCPFFFQMPFPQQNRCFNLSLNSR